MPKIVFNENFGVDEITIVLERRDFSKYGKLKDVTDIEYKDTMNAPELSFNVYKLMIKYGIKLIITIWYISLNTKNIFQLV